MSDPTPSAGRLQGGMRSSASRRPPGSPARGLSRAVLRPYDLSTTTKLVDITIRSASVEDAAEVVRIYNPYVADTWITFEVDPVPVSEEMADRIHDILATPLPWLVAETASGLAGFAYASKWKARHAYRFSVESTVYLDPRHAGAGIGVALYSELIAQLRRSSVHAVIGGVALPNAASVKLHERLGFEKVAHFRQTGFKQSRWIDVAYWQLLL